MQSTDFFNNMPASLAAKVQAYADATAAKAYSICRRHDVPHDVADVFIMDAVDILRAQYVGLRATTEQMRVLTEKVPQRSWARTENVALCFMAKYYTDIVAREYGLLPAGYIGFLNAVVGCEVAKRNAEKPDMICVYDDGEMAEIHNEAQRLYYTYAVLIAAEFCGATEDELRGIKPNGVTMTDAQVKHAIEAGLDFQRQRQKQRTPARQASQDKGHDTDDAGLFDAQGRATSLPVSLPPSKTIKQFQNVAYMIGTGIQTADAHAAGRGDVYGKLPTLPLSQAIEKQRQAALALSNDVNASDDEKLRAAQLITNTYAVTQVMDGLQILPQVLPPDSGTTSRMIWDMTTYQYARIMLGIENPAAEQVMALLRATAFLSTQRAVAVEKATKRVIKYNADGTPVLTDGGKPKREMVERDVYINFQPVVVEFRTEYQNDVLIEDATRIRVEVHRLFADGRSAEYIGDGKQREYIAKPQQQYLTIGKYYEFSSENERVFRNIILSKPKQAEDAMLSAVFNYPQRQAKQDAAAAEARATAQQTRTAADAIAANPTATPEQKAVAAQQAAEAEAEAERAAKRAKYYINNHIGDDVRRLKSMFEKALQNGLITSYYDTGRDDSGKPRYGRGVVWHWLRPTAEDVKRRKR